MILRTNDIKDFQLLRKQLNPLLNDKSKALLERIEAAAGAEFPPGAPETPVKITHGQRVNKHLKFYNHGKS